MSDPHSGPAAGNTRGALIEAALELFGEKGFDGASTREIAAAAGANIGSIAYHFGGKERLYLACADHVVAMLGEVAGRALGEEASQKCEVGPALTSGEAGKRLSEAIEGMVAFVVAGDAAGGIVRFVLRELQNPTEALETIYSGVFEPVHKRLCGIWAEATGEDAESERTRLTVFTLLGQVLYFRIAREAVLRRMGWDAVGASEARSIANVAKANLAAIMASSGRGLS